MKQILERIIILLFVFIIIFNISFPAISHAVTFRTFFSDEFEKTWLDYTFKGWSDGIIGMGTWLFRAPLAAIGYVLQVLITQVSGLGIDLDPSTTGAGIMLTPEDIIFTGSSFENQVTILNVNFFDFSDQYESNRLISNFREGVAKWYYALRNLSITISLAVLLYIGIRMAISTVASDKAVYKKMLTDWLVGFIVLFLLHYFMILIFNFNEQLVELLYQIYKGDVVGNYMPTYMSELLALSFSPSFATGIGSLVMYICLLGVVIALFIMYMKRLFTVGFLVVISPLITITYSIDKLGDNKSQALNTWMKEFIYNVLVQPFHCIIYMVFVGSSLKIVDAGDGIAAIVFAFGATIFMFKAEGIIKKIFGFDKASSAEGMLAAGAIAGSALGKLSSGASKVGKEASSTSKAVAAATGSTGTNTGIKRKTANSSNILNGNSSKTTNSSSTPKSTSKKTSRISKSAFGRAAADMVGNAKSNWSDFTASPGKNIARGAGQLFMRSLKASAELSPKIFTGLLISGATGNAMTGFAAGVATKGNRYTRKIASMAEEDINDMKMAKEARKLATAYQSYRMANNNLSDDELYDRSADLLEADIRKLTDKNEINLARELQNMQAKYDQIGTKKPNEAVMKQIEGIQLGTIKGRSDITLDKVGSAVQKFKKEQPTVTNSDINSITRSLISDMDNLKQNYLKSPEFTKLETSEKEIAREIFKAKKVLGAIGENSDAAINKEIQESIKRSLSK